MNDYKWRAWDANGVCTEWTHKPQYDKGSGDWWTNPRYAEVAMFGYNPDQNRKRGGPKAIVRIKGKA